MKAGLARRNRRIRRSGEPSGPRTSVAGNKSAPADAATSPGQAQEATLPCTVTVPDHPRPAPRHSRRSVRSCSSSSSTRPRAAIRSTCCRAAGVPYIIGGQRPPVVKVGPTFVPGATACFACQETALARDFPLYPELARQRDETPLRSITLGPASGIAGTLIASEVMRLLLGRDVATAGRALLVDLRSLATRWEAVERQPDCPACA